MNWVSERFNCREEFVFQSIIDRLKNDIEYVNNHLKWRYGNDCDLCKLIMKNKIRAEIWLSKNGEKTFMKAFFEMNRSSRSVDARIIRSKEVFDDFNVLCEWDKIAGKCNLRWKSSHFDKYSPVQFWQISQRFLEFAF